MECLLEGQKSTHRYFPQNKKTLKKGERCTQLCFSPFAFGKKYSRILVSHPLKLDSGSTDHSRLLLRIMLRKSKV